jgi:hypothetical protein
MVVSRPPVPSDCRGYPQERKGFAMRIRIGVPLSLAWAAGALMYATPARAESVPDTSGCTGTLATTLQPGEPDPELGMDLSRGKPIAQNQVAYRPGVNTANAGRATSWTRASRTRTRSVSRWLVTSTTKAQCTTVHWIWGGISALAGMIICASQSRYPARHKSSNGRQRPSFGLWKIVRLATTIGCISSMPAHALTGRSLAIRHFILRPCSPRT